MSWWDGSMQNQTNRTLLQWKLLSGKHDKRRSLFGPPPGEGRSMPVSRSTQRKHNAERSRMLAEQFEGISSRHDSSDLLGPFSRVTLWRDLNRWRRLR